jgi:nucleotidyltransferase substrate binding protein (TIGR01987 family)
MQDIRWMQRFDSFLRALSQLEEACTLAASRPLSRLEEQGLIQTFEFTHELAWKTLKDFLESRGVQDLYGSKDTTREAFKNSLVHDGEIWMDMIVSRNLTSRTYDEATASRISARILKSYFDEFKRFRAIMERFRENTSL